MKLIETDTSELIRMVLATYSVRGHSRDAMEALIRELARRIDGGKDSK